MRSFAIDEPSSSVCALYATLVDAVVWWTCKDFGMQRLSNSHCSQRNQCNFSNHCNYCNHIQLPIASQQRATLWSHSGPWSISKRGREREGRHPHPGKNAIFMATLQTMVVVRLANLLHPSPTPWFIQDWSSLFNAFTPRNDCGGDGGVNQVCSSIIIPCLDGNCTEFNVHGNEPQGSPSRTQVQK